MAFPLVPLAGSGTHDTYPLGTWFNFPYAAECGTGNTTAQVCEFLGNSSYRNVLLQNGLGAISASLGVGCVSPSNTVGALLQLQYANFSTATGLNVSNFVNLGTGIFIDNSANHPCPGNLESANVPLPPVSAVIFRVVGLNGGGSGDNPRVAFLDVRVRQTVRPLISEAVVTNSTSSAIVQMSTNFGVAALTIVRFTWIATDGTTTQSGRSLCGIPPNASVCTVTITFSPAFVSVPNMGVAIRTTLVAVNVPITTVTLFRTEVVTV